MRKWILAALVALAMAVAVPLALIAAPTTTVGADSSISTPTITKSNTTGSDSDFAQIYYSEVPGAGGYNVYRDGQYLRSTPNTVFVDVPSRGVHTYYVTAFDASKQHFSARSNEVTVDTSGPTRKLPTQQKPQTPEWKSGFGAFRGDLFWHPVSGADGVNIYRNGTYLTTVNSKIAFFDDRYLSGDEYYIVAFNDAGFSGKSSTIS